MKINKTLATVFSILTLSTSSAYAFNVSLRFTNDTNTDLRPEGTLTYEQDGIDHYQELIKPPTLFVPAHAQNAAADVLRVGLDDYFLEYFELFDENKKMLGTCLDSYVPITKDAVITFRLKQMGRDNPRYYCSYTIDYQK